MRQQSYPRAYGYTYANSVHGPRDWSRPYKTTRSKRSSERLLLVDANSNLAYCPACFGMANPNIWLRPVHSPEDGCNVLFMDSHAERVSVKELDNNTGDLWGHSAE